MGKDQNVIHLPSLLDNKVDGIIVGHFFKHFNAAPLLHVVLEDFNRPQELMKYLKLLLKADKKLQAFQLNEDKDEYDCRRFFIKELIAAIKAGMPAE